MKRKTKIAATAALLFVCLCFNASAYREEYDGSFVITLKQVQSITRGSTVVTSAVVKSLDPKHTFTFVEIEEGITRIDTGAFANHKTLQRITIPASIEVIAPGAFYSCPHLSSVSIANGVKSIQKDAFRDCAKLGIVLIPESVETICENAFLGCADLALVTFQDKADWKKYTRRVANLIDSAEYNADIDANNAQNLKQLRNNEKKFCLRKGEDKFNKCCAKNPDASVVADCNCGK